ncbi:MAG: hypothetical protein C0403_04760 [Desulfobacterium sp.]|nr:hypothetical protein [Desulfobacterium sp.]
MDRCSDQGRASKNQMKTKGWLLLAFGSACIVLSVWGQLGGKKHRFSETECGLCHLDAKNDPHSLKTLSSDKCEGCHVDRRSTLSHPFNIIPEGTIPVDMPLVDGKLTCVTCHFTHPFSIRNPILGFYLLRRPGKGVSFCSVCHRIDAKGHILFENVHHGSFRETDREQTLDEYTLQCIECHDRQIDRSMRSLGAGNWLHRAIDLNHPVGVSYQQAANHKSQDFHPQATLPSEIRLYNGKIGCGTCHNVYSKEKYMLAIGNRRSGLCLQCHIK